MTTELIPLTKPMYVVKANQKLNLYLGFANGVNAAENKIIDLAQDKLDFAFYFSTFDEAKQFLNTYFIDKSDKISPMNKQYYNIEAKLEVPYIPNVNVVLYNTVCWYSKEAYRVWRANPQKYRNAKNRQYVNSL